MQLPTLLELLKVGAHFGHSASRWHPKMEPYLFGTRNNVHIINLEKTLEALEQATAYVRELVAGGGAIIFVGTKTQAQEIAKRYAVEGGMPFVVRRWLGGTLTNFQEMRRRVKYFLDLKHKKDSGELQKYTKKEQLLFGREIEDLEEKFGGVSGLERLPNALFVIDVRHEETAVREAAQTGVKVVAICDSNIDPTDIEYCIPGNDDAVKSIELFTRLIAEAVKEGKELAATRAKEAQAKAVEQTQTAL
ncbi:30S ribosomal protein S2 [Candidatus Uhrbacteria bacterium]|nr:30S ribosomal protein S2 [Candidatus Uhrbacteria bacterium]